MNEESHTTVQMSEAREPQARRDDTLHAVIGCLLRGDDDAAVAGLAELLDQPPDSATVSHAAGAICAEQGHWTAAETWLRRAVGKDPHFAVACNDLGVALFRQEKRWQARAAFRHGLEAAPDFGNCADNLDELDAQLAAADRLVESAGSKRLLWQLESARALIVDALRKAPDHAPALALLAAIEQEAGESARAARVRDLVDGFAPEIVCAARPFSDFERALRTGTLVAGTSFGPRRPLVSVRIDGEAHRMPIDAASADAWAGGNAAAANLLLALAWAHAGDHREACVALRAWFADRDPDHCCRLVAGADGLELAIERSGNAALDRDAKFAVLLELAWRCDHEDVAAVATLCLASAYSAAGYPAAALPLREATKDRPRSAAIVDQLRFRLDRIAAAGTVAARRGPPRNCLLIGTCIVQVIRYLLNASEDFRRTHRLHTFFTNMDIPEARLFDISDALLGSAAAVIHVHPTWADWGNEQAYADLLARIPVGVQRISIPYPVFQPLWPFHCKEPRNGAPWPESLRRPMGETPSWPYGDSMLLALMKRHAATAEVVSAYLALDLSREIDLDRLLAKTLEIQRDKEQVTDVKIVDFIAETFRQRRLFTTVNHLSNDGMLYMTNQILQHLELPAIDAGILDTLGELLSPEMPVHPSVCRHFGLRYCDERTRYPVDAYRRLTFAEYVADYVRFS